MPVSDGPSTVQRALSLLDHFSERRPHIGLSEFAKLSGYNKASTLRFLTALETKGFVEQDEATRTYMLGPAFLRFSLMREAIFPMADAVQATLSDLSAATRETSHASILIGGALTNIGTVASTRSNRVIVELGEVLPFHATASGLVFLGFAAPDVVDQALSTDLDAHAPGTITDPAEVRAQLARIRAQGHATAQSSYEDGVSGFAAPCFGPGGRVCGAVAVAMPTVRVTDSHVVDVIQKVRVAACHLTLLRGGTLPEGFPTPQSARPGAQEDQP